jgi:TRAP-type C4-dicarboxylate transport system permease small subunit
VQVKRLLGRLDKIGIAAETVTLVTMLTTLMLVAVGQIVMRQVFESSLSWADELVRLMVLWLALVGSIAACRENRHIRIDALSHVLPDTAVKLIRILVDVFAAIVCGIIAVQAWRYLQVEIEYEVTVLVDTPAWIAHAIMPAAFALISYRFLIDVFSETRELLFGEEAEVAE